MRPKARTAILRRGVVITTGIAHSVAAAASVACQRRRLSAAIQSSMTRTFSAAMTARVRAERATSPCRAPFQEYRRSLNERSRRPGRASRHHRRGRLLSPLGIDAKHLERPRAGAVIEPGNRYGMVIPVPKMRISAKRAVTFSPVLLAASNHALWRCRNSHRLPPPDRRAAFSPMSPLAGRMDASGGLI